MKTRLVLFFILTVFFLSCSNGTSGDSSNADELGFSINVSKSLDGAISGNTGFITARGMTDIAGKTITVWTSYDTSIKASVELDSTGCGSGTLTLPKDAVGKTITVFAIVGGAPAGGVTGAETRIGISDPVVVSEEGTSGTITMSKMVFTTNCSVSNGSATSSYKPQGTITITAVFSGSSYYNGKNLPENAGGSFEWKFIPYRVGESPSVSNALSFSKTTTSPSLTLDISELGDINSSYVSSDQFKIAYMCRATYNGVTTRNNSFGNTKFTYTTP